MKEQIHLFGYLFYILFSVIFLIFNWTILITWALWALFYFMLLVCNISNMKLMNSLLLDWIPYNVVAMCINGNKCWCCIINVLNGTIVEKYNLGLDGVSSTLFCLSENLASFLEYNIRQTSIHLYENKVFGSFERLSYQRMPCNNKNHYD